MNDSKVNTNKKGVDADMGVDWWVCFDKTLYLYSLPPQNP